jgi:hypothetical protein
VISRSLGLAERSPASLVFYILEVHSVFDQGVGERRAEASVFFEFDRSLMRSFGSFRCAPAA